MSIVICTILISLQNNIIKPQNFVDLGGVSQIPTWIPAVFGLITPVFFSVNGVLTKTLTSEKVGFNATRISFTSYLYVNIVLLVAAIPYWNSVYFSQKLFWLGFGGSTINVIGLVFL